MCSECGEYCSRDREREKDSLERFSEKALGYGLRHAAMFVLTGGVGNAVLAAGEILSEIADAADASR